MCGGSISALYPVSSQMRPPIYTTDVKFEIFTDTISIILFIILSYRYGNRTRPGGVAQNSAVSTTACLFVIIRLTGIDISASFSILIIVNDELLYGILIVIIWPS